MARFLNYRGVGDDKVLTNAGTTTGALTSHRGADGVAARRDAQKVVIVDGSTEILELLETVLDAGRYDVVFVESNAHAYSQIKRVQPDLVILCVRIDEPRGFQVLSMLKLDADTRDIPILTYMTEFDGEDPREASPEPADDEIFVPAPAVRMN